MELIHPGSRGAARLSIHGSRSRDGAGPGAALISSQHWSFPVHPASLGPHFSLGELYTQAGLSTRTQLTPPTKSSSARHRLSLYPCDSAEAGSSVDADILAAQSYLRQHHPDVDIPDHLLSELIYDNANALQDTAHDLDGSMGIAEALAIAILGPVALGQKRVYAIVCVGGHNNDCLLLHQLQVHTDSIDSSPPLNPVKSETSQAKGKAKATDSSRLSFVPALSAEQMFQTPILQLVATADRTLLAVRTHISTSFLSLRHGDVADGAPWLYLETVHQVRYGKGNIAQHQDVCFGRTGSGLAATVDRHGSIDVYRFSQEGEAAQQLDPAMDQVDRSSQPAAASASKPKERRNFITAPSASTSAASSASISVAAQRISATLFGSATADVEDDATPQPRHGEDASGHGPYRVLFAPDHGSLFVLTRHVLLRVSLEHSQPDVEAGVSPKVDPVLETSLCLSSFKRARFFSIAMTGADSRHHLLAVCSSDTIFWFDLQEPFQPLFSTEHHRGDDPTLTLSFLPSQKDLATADSAQADEDAIMCVLSSRRNELTSCYVLGARRHQGPGHDLLRSASATAQASAEWTYTLQPTPVLVPTALSSTSRHDGPAAPPVFIDAADILQGDDGPPAYFAFRLDQRGALLVYMVRLHSSTEDPTPVDGGVRIEIVPPPSDSHLYIDDTNSSHSSQADIDGASYVKTRILDYRKLHRSLFAPTTKSSATKQQSDAVSDVGRGAARLISLLTNPSKGQAAVEATTLSLGQLFHRLHQDADTDAQSTASRRPWSSALNLEGDKQAQLKQAKAVLDLRDDLRRALSSLGTSSAQGAWSRAATGVAGHGAKGNPALAQEDILKRALELSHVQDEAAAYLPTKKAVQGWSANQRRSYQESLRNASREMMLDLALEAEVFVRPKARILDEGAPRQRPQQRQGTNWTAFEHRDIYRFVEEQGDVIPPPHIGSVGLSFFAPLRSGDVEAAAVQLGPEQNGSKKRLDEAELEALLPSTSSTARLLLAEWQLGEDPAEYSYLDPFQGLHRLPRASRMRGPTARARSRSFSRASSASTEDRSRSRSRSRKQSAAPSQSQPGVYDSQGPPSSYPPSLVAASQAASVASPAPPTLVSRRKRQRDGTISRSQPIRAPAQVYNPAETAARRPAETPSAAQSQPAAPKFGFAGSFGDLTPTVSPASSQVGTPTRTTFGAASTQIEAGRFGARPAKPDRPPKKKKRASGF
ncbi:conserved hypothetical protein [Sporisorium reilianum SRZ2]|uniref:RRN6 K-rich C-terminal domain-containing protein n=1 Tax=Sporisorium reilianum (strain SRZ2) TaxID=999809 RepID=E6ZYG9_SPORE|nr:conserved hypothetical protein [Sporisorium reilianum SRZ2]